jgi:carboxylesterase
MDLEIPVVICAHGFSASTFEWSEFRDFSKTQKKFFTSQVLLGSHGRDYADFKAGTWQQWQQPIIDEYNKLRTLGYKRIYFAGTSTGCALIIDIIKSNMINTDVLKHIFFYRSNCGSFQQNNDIGFSGRSDTELYCNTKGEGRKWFLV